MNDERIKAKLNEKFGPDTFQFQTIFDQMSVCVPPELILDICFFLRDDPELEFDFLSFVGAVDYYPFSPRFELVYQLYSLPNVKRFS